MYVMWGYPQIPQTYLKKELEALYPILEHKHLLTNLWHQAASYKSSNNPL